MSMIETEAALAPLASIDTIKKQWINQIPIYRLWNVISNGALYIKLLS